MNVKSRDRFYKSPITPQLKSLYAYLSDCADKGLPCPRNDEIAASHAGSNEQSAVSIQIKSLEARGLIIINRQSKASRSITIVETGKKTAPTDKQEARAKKKRYVNERAIYLPKLGAPLSHSERDIKDVSYFDPHNNDTKKRFFDYWVKPSDEIRMRENAK